MYSPPASGKAAANSAHASAPARDSTPPNVQTTSIKPGLGSCSAITPLVVKIPTPIVLPTTSIVALNKPIDERCEPSTEGWLRFLPFLLSTLTCLLKNPIPLVKTPVLTPPRPPRRQSFYSVSARSRNALVMTD